MQMINSKLIWKKSLGFVVLLSLFSAFSQPVQSSEATQAPIAPLPFEMLVSESQLEVLRPPVWYPTFVPEGMALVDVRLEDVPVRQWGILQMHTLVFRGNGTSFMLRQRLSQRKDMFSCPVQASYRWPFVAGLARVLEMTSPACDPQGRLLSPNPLDPVLQKRIWDSLKYRAENDALYKIN